MAGRCPPSQPSEAIPVVMVSCDAYACGLAVTLSSLLRNTARVLDVYVVDLGLTAAHRNDLEQLHSLNWVRPDADLSASNRSPNSGARIYLCSARRQACKKM